MGGRIVDRQPPGFGDRGAGDHDPQRRAFAGGGRELIDQCLAAPPKLTGAKAHRAAPRAGVAADQHGFGHQSRGQSSGPIHPGGDRPAGIQRQRAILADALLDLPLHGQVIAKPAARSSARVSYSGKPMTPEWLPPIQAISASARPWMA